MLILNINGPINSNKETISKILVNLLPKAVFIKADKLMHNEEQHRLPIQGDLVKKRLNTKLLMLKQTKEYEYIIFTTDKNYQNRKRLIDKTTYFLNVTLAPSLEENFPNRPHSDFIINNSHQMPEDTAKIIKGFIEHVLSPKQQWLHLVERRWPALLNGEKTSTLRLNEGFIHKGFLVYKDYPKEQLAEVVLVTQVYYLPLKQTFEIEGFDEHTPDIETGLKQMRVHYPDITLDTLILFAKHLSVSETKKLYPHEVTRILDVFMRR